MKYIKQGSISQLENDMFIAKGVLYANDVPKVLWCEQPEAGTEFTIKYNEESGKTTAFFKLPFTFGTVESHTKPKADAIVGDICYYGETPIGVVVIKGDETVKIMSLFELNEDGTNSPDHSSKMKWSEAYTEETGVIDANDGKANTAALVALGSDYKPAIACSLYSTEGTSKGDWYLPAEQELTKMWSTNTSIQASLNSLGSVAISIDGNYWSSTEDDYNKLYAWSLISNGRPSINCYYKSATRMVRAFCEI